MRRYIYTENSQNPLMRNAANTRCHKMALFSLFPSNIFFWDKRAVQRFVLVDFFFQQNIDLLLMQNICISPVSCPASIPPLRPLCLTHKRTIQEYLYRFVALAAGGWAAGPWQRGRSRSKGKKNVFSPWKCFMCFFFTKYILRSLT